MRLRQRGQGQRNQRREQRSGNSPTANQSGSRAEWTSLVCDATNSFSRAALVARRSPTANIDLHLQWRSHAAPSSPKEDADGVAAMTVDEDTSTPPCELDPQWLLMTPAQLKAECGRLLSLETQLKDSRMGEAASQCCQRASAIYVST